MNTIKVKDGHFLTISGRNLEVFGVSTYKAKRIIDPKKVQTIILREKK